MNTLPANMRDRFFPRQAGYHPRSAGREEELEISSLLHRRALSSRPPHQPESPGMRKLMVSRPVCKTNFAFLQALIISE